MEKNDQFLKLEKENNRLRSKISGLSTALFIFIFLFVLTLGYLVFIEFSTPFFGRYKTMTEEHGRFKTASDSVNYFRTNNDSLLASNDILAEQNGTNQGVFFEVQIGAFEKFNLEKYKEDLANLRSENVDILDKYTIGRFRDYRKAQAFKNDMEKMGIKGAFIVGRIDGQRVEIKEALRAARKRK